MGFLRNRFSARNVRLDGRSFLRLIFPFFSSFVCFNLPVSAQYHFDGWTTDNGLPQNTVRTVLQTSDGYIWFPTLDGLVRFDGVRFTVFNKSNSKGMPGNRLINLFAEPDDTLWICTDAQGVVRYRNGEFRTFTTADGLPANNVIEISRAFDGNLTAVTRDGIYRFDGTSFTAIENETEINKFERHISSSGTIIEIDKTSLTVIKDGVTKNFELPEKLKRLLEIENNIFISVALFEDSRQNIQIAIKQPSDFSEVLLFKFSNGNFEETGAENMPRSTVFNMEEDRHGNLWFATQKDGACRLSENKVTCFTPENGFPSRFVRNIVKDREGNLWLTTEEKGIYRLSEQAISPLSTADGLAEKNVYAIYEDRTGAIWIGSLGGLARYKNSQFTNFKNADGLKYTDVQSLFEDRDGRLWIGSLNGIIYYENGRFYDQTEKIAPQSNETAFFDVHQDRNGILWFATNIGLIRYDGVESTLLTVADGLPGNNVKTILENADGSFWLGTYNGIALYKDGKFTAYTERDGLAGNHVRALYKDETDALWIGTYDSGLSRFKDGKFTRITIENGLASNGVFQILEDAGKNFWMSSNQGIYRVARAQLEDFADGKRNTITSTMFGKTDGLASTEANGGGSPAGIKTKDGRLWFPTQNGIAVIDTEKVRPNTLPPPVVIEKARIDNQIIDSGTEIKVQSGQANLEIDYTGLSFIKPDQVRFRYRLEGLDENWTEAQNRRTAYYAHLTPGEYVFRVIAANSDNVWNEQGASIKIIVLPPFYRTWWFMILSCAAITAFVFWLYQRRVRQIELKQAAQEEFSRRLIAAHETERRRVAAELHDSLGQTLAMIKNRAVFARKNTKNIEEAENEFDQITAQSVEAINEVREISYNLRPYLLDNLGLTKALKSLFNKTVETSELKIVVQIENIDKILTGEEEMNLYRIIQESLNNIIKHAAARTVEINIKRSENDILIKIRDDGRGFSMDEKLHDNKKGGFGLLGMSERVKIIGGTHKIESAIGEGTRITIRINISEKNANRNGKSNQNNNG